MDDAESDRCPCGCGQPIAEATEKGRGYVVQTYECMARKALEMKKRDDRAAAGEDPPEGWDDGRIYYIEGSVEPPEGGARRGN